MSLPDLSLLAHGAAPTAPPAEAYIGTFGLRDWCNSTRDVLARIVHVVPEGAPEGTQPKPPFVPLAVPATNSQRIDHIIAYLTTHFGYIDYGLLVPLSNSEKAKQITVFLETMPPFKDEFWLTLDEARKAYADKAFPLHYTDMVEFESSLATV